MPLTKALTFLKITTDMSNYDFDNLKKLAYDACIRTCELLSELTPEQLGVRVRSIYRPNEYNCLSEFNALLPNYHSRITYDKFCEIWESKESLSFLAELSGCPLLPDYMASDKKDISSWNRLQAGQLIQSSLDSALDRTAIIHFIDGNNNPKTWSLDESILIEIINNSIEGLIEYPANNIHYIKAICPIREVEFPNRETIFSEGVKIKEWSIRERAILMSMYHDAFLQQEDMSRRPSFYKYFIEMELNIEPGKSAHEAIVNNIDGLKWAIMMATNSDQPPSEGICFILTKSGMRLNSIRREDRLKHATFKLGALTSKKCVSLFTGLNKSFSEDYGLNNALWHFGRSCTSAIERDTLLEAAIGIDSIVSPGGGDSLYKFCLHGAALLTAIDTSIDINIFKNLKDIYACRSSAAHGIKSTSKGQPSLPEKTRFYLAKMIESVLTLNEQDVLKINKGSKVADAVQQFVIDRVITKGISPRRAQ